MKIAVLLSGGVDSSVAMRLLRRQGHELEAFYLKVWLQDDLAALGDCPWEEDIAYASQAASQLGIPFHVVGMQEAYWQKVVGYAIGEIKAGHTPNPDIMCNALMKFGVFYERYGVNYDAVASGHYARLLPSEEISAANIFMRKENINIDEKYWENQWKPQKFLVASPDEVKDQTYFLARMSLKQLQHCIFPLGKCRKEEVRLMAASYQLPNAARKDSQGVCFLGKIKFSSFIAHHLGKRKGPIVNIADKTVLGEHNGYWFYTIDQRKGLGLGGGPWYVCGKDITNNTVYVCHGEAAKKRKTNVFYARDMQFLLPTTAHLLHELQQGRYAGCRLRVRIRHGGRQLLAKSLAKWGNSWRVLLAEEENGVAPGQFAVFYVEDICMGSGVIATSAF